MSAWGDGRPRGTDANTDPPKKWAPSLVAQELNVKLTLLKRQFTMLDIPPGSRVPRRLYPELEGVGESCALPGLEKKRDLRRSRFRRICVYCGSAKGKKPSYQDAAVELGKELVDRGIDLVYGGGSIGLMGLVSHAVHAGGRHVIGIIPKSLMPREVTGEPVGEVRAVSGMHERKAEMARFADAFIALPGGYGTLEELLEVITWAQLGIHKKPVKTHSQTQLAMIVLTRNYLFLLIIDHVLICLFR
ncbi:hypothetical protein E2562_027132 [Oryza meyeriana var. granulata]|uniref:Cytokinin riboside 5'-monophosphate phosphoribohydrolase n=1 Tax=Oryza meyeriana var. granulata TaxID=110450 RepID=A0A6G1EPY7_9ORYZ|nr:hypothetical protein E2562_027132 [Oryza meyeriana var. granulata]